MSDKKQQALHLYMTQNMSQKQIANEVGVSDRTLYTWIHQNAWDELKRAAYQAPAIIAQNFSSQLIEMQNHIAKREEGNRFPTPQEAEVMRKLVTCIDKMKKHPSLSMNMQVLETFKNYIRPIDQDFAIDLGNYTERFLSGKAVNGFAPHELEFGVEQVAPIMPFYEEPHEPADPATLPCKNILDCKNPVKGCTYPKCLHSQQQKNSWSSDPLKQQQVIPVPAISAAEQRAKYRKFMEANGFEFDANGRIIDPTSEETGSKAEGSEATAA